VLFLPFYDNIASEKIKSCGPLIFGSRLWGFAQNAKTRPLSTTDLCRKGGFHFRGATFLFLTDSKLESVILFTEDAGPYYRKAASPARTPASAGNRIKGFCYIQRSSSAKAVNCLTEDIGWLSSET